VTCNVRVAHGHCFQAADKKTVRAKVLQAK
jgi:hypothetical protein